MPHRFALFAYGFRPFFLLAALQAVMVMAVWLCAYFDPALWPINALPPWLWHAHEMMFGFVPAAIAGFLLTAVPSWTGTGGYSGARLAGLTGLWLLGRIAVLPAAVPEPMAALADLLFFPALAAMLAAPLIRAGKWRNMAFLVLLALLFAANLAFHLGRMEILPGGELIGLVAAAEIVAVVVAVIGGRIIPAFTQGALRQLGIGHVITPLPALDAAAVVSLVLVLIADLTTTNTVVAGTVALAAAILHGARLARWQGWQARRTPLVWVLHVGYGFLVLALALKGIGLLTGSALGAKWLHALTIGCFGTMILGVMTRASLGHTGRALVPPRAVVAAYVLVPAAAMVRAFVPALMPDAYAYSVAASGGLWLAAFLLFLAWFGPILIGPRADGRPG
ncbi:MAG: NnrS family protein [Pseudomonadota bacterium]|nr:NnrS family protein [Pseudomonadota bacterium]